MPGTPALRFQPWKLIIVWKNDNTKKLLLSVVGKWVGEESNPFLTLFVAEL